MGGGLRPAVPVDASGRCRPIPRAKLS